VSFFGSKFDSLVQHQYMSLMRKLGRASFSGVGNEVAICINRKSSHSVYFKNIPVGEFRVRIEHSDALLFSRRKGMHVSVKMSRKKATAKAAAELGINYSDEIGPYFYFGGGHKKPDGGIVQYQSLKIDVAREWLMLNFKCVLPRYLNIDRVVLEPMVQQIGKARKQSAMVATKKGGMAPQIDPLVNVLAGHKDVMYVVHAPISPNIVDGSSIWLSSITTILAKMGKVILLLKVDPTSDIILSNIENRDNVTILSPSSLGIQGELTHESAADIVRRIDLLLPMLRLVVVRGLDAALSMLDTKQLYGRVGAYITDFYEICDGKVEFDKAKVAGLKVVTTQAGRMLCQTSQVERAIRGLVKRNFVASLIPPPIPSSLTYSRPRPIDKGRIRIGYSGKITPLWGITELLDWVEGYQQRVGTSVELHIVANRISGPRGDGGKFRNGLLARFMALGAKHYTDLNRDASINLMKAMDFVWCFRPAIFEDATLEVSTKLVEMVAAGGRAICYPSDINKELLGNNYPYYISDGSDLDRVLKADAPDFAGNALSDRVKYRHGMDSIVDRVKAEIPALSSNSNRERTAICFAAHDFKFIYPYASTLKADGYSVIVDQWQWGEPLNEMKSRACLESSDIIFCEWGLANAVWYSQNNHLKKPLFIRVHAQEVRNKARKFGAKIAHDNVTKFIFVSEWVRDEAVRLWGWPLEKTEVIPNFVLDDQFQLDRQYEDQSSVQLGMVGIVPQTKRFDRAIDLLLELCDRGVDAYLHIKGHRPEALPFMHAPGRKAELSYYEELYRRIDENSVLRDRVIFYPWGNDVAQWYENIDYVLSPSDSESFHYAVADGVLSGCVPIVWPWNSADQIYPKWWVVRNTTDAADTVMRLNNMSAENREQLCSENRNYIIRKYSKDTIFSNLNSVVLRSHIARI